MRQLQISFKTAGRHSRTQQMELYRCEIAYHLLMRISENLFSRIYFVVLLHQWKLVYQILFGFYNVSFGIYVIPKCVIVPISVTIIHITGLKYLDGLC